MQREIDNVKHWLDANKLRLNVIKNIQMNLQSSKSRFDIDKKKFISIEPVCKHLGILIDFKFFVSHLAVLKSRLSKQCRIISKLRHHAPVNQLIDYYKTNVSSIIQYGIIVYGCSSYSNPLPIYNLQKKILKPIYLRQKYDSAKDIFVKK